MILSSTAVSTADHSSAVSPANTLSSKDRTGVVQFGTRLVEIAALRQDGSRFIEQMTVPALPLFEKAFSAFAHSTILQTETGEMAIEDIQPGDRLWTSAGTAATVMWIGCSHFRLSEAGRSKEPLVRIMSDTFGEGRPDSFLTLGPSARILQTPPHLRAETSGQVILAPVQEFIDGVNVIEVTPPTSVPLFHLVLDRHASIRAGNLECETFHPGNQCLRAVSHSLRDLFLSMFPHISHASDFGPLAHPRAAESLDYNSAQVI